MTISRQVRVYIGCLVETKEDDGRRRMMTLKLLAITWILLLVSFVWHLPQAFNMVTITGAVGSLLLDVVFYRRTVTPYGVI